MITGVCLNSDNGNIVIGNGIFAELYNKDDPSHKRNQGDENPTPAVSTVTKAAYANSETGQNCGKRIETDENLNSDYAKNKGYNKVDQKSHPITTNSGTILEVDIVLPHVYVFVEESHY